MTPLSSKTALDSYFFEARCKILDLAAILDRIDRGDGHTAVVADARLAKIRQALAVLQGNDPERAEGVQQIFSLAYDATWEKPTRRG